MANINRRRSCYFIYSINPWTFANLCGTVVYCKGGADMARMSLEELYRGEGAGERYSILGEVMKDFLQMGVRGNTTSVLGLICCL